MKVTVVGTGYVGLVTGACLSEMGNHVLCLDVDAKKIRILLDGGLPIYEPGLLEMVKRNAEAGRLQFTTDVEKAVSHGTIQFLAVGTPQDEDGSADLQYVLAAARNIGRTMTDRKIIVDKSTVPVGTGDKVKAVIREELAKRGIDTHFSIVSNPEFLKEGSAVNDFMRPDRVVIGADDEQAILLMRALYAPFISNRDRMMVMDIRSAEFTKYAANAMLATRISFMNELSLVAEKVGADIDLVRRGMGSDPRIGSQFLYAGCGYGGSCFPKDVSALVNTAASVGQPLQLLTAVEAVNAQQKMVLVDKIVRRYGEDLSGKTFAMWGLAFKPNTDDMRDAPSRVVIGELTKRGARVNAYDPVAAHEASRVMPGHQGLGYASTAVEALEGADALVIVTEWKEFRTPDFEEVRDALKDALVFDGRNLYDPEMMQSFGIEYQAIGRGQALSAAQSVISSRRALNVSRLLAAAAVAAALCLVTGVASAAGAGADCLPATADAAGAASGPTPYPQDASAMPGRGNFRAMGWMTDNRKSFWRKRAEDRCAVVFVGDSLIAGWTNLKADFGPMKVANRGIGGDVSRGVLFRLEEDVLDLSPRAVVILVGTNDLSAKEDTAITSSNLDTIVQRIKARAPDAPIVLCQLPPRDNPAAKIDSAELLALNKKYADLAVKYPGVSVVDLYKTFVMPDGTPDPRYFKPDHLHLNDEGHAKARDQILPALARADVK